MIDKLSVERLPVEGKRVLVRVDLNVPLAAGKVADDTRIGAILPTVRHLLARDAAVILMSHLGRPGGRRVPELSLAPVAVRLAELLGQPVPLAADATGAEVESMAASLQAGDVMLLENLRFHAGEEACDADFADGLARLGDLYVNDAFGTAHRAHASTVGVAERLRPAAAGLLMTRELEVLGGLLARPEPPAVAILGGAKISGKIDVIQKLLPRVDGLLIGGGMMFTFLRAQGLEVGRSLVEEDRIGMATSLLGGPGGDKIVLPVDCRVARAADGTGGKPTIVPVDRIPTDQLGVDIGPRTAELFAKVVEDARLIFWNGPLGIFEVEDFATGTLEVARRVAAATERGATTVVGGGDSVAALRRLGFEHQVSHLSTGGGATLEFLEGKELPGVAVLTDAAEAGSRASR